MITKTRITVNGNEYSSIDEMPPDVRAQYDKAMSMLADRDGNGVPDILEGKAGIGSMIKEMTHGPLKTVVKTSTRFMVNGKDVGGFEDLPGVVKKVLGISQPSTGSPNEQARVVVSSGLFRLNWSILLALIAAVSVTAVVVWFLR